MKPDLKYTGDPWESIAINAIYQAVDDYSHACVAFINALDYDNRLNEEMRNKILDASKQTIIDCVEFFRSSVICDVLIPDSSVFIEKMDEYIDEGKAFDRTSMRWRKPKANALKLMRTL